jgi:hypothetical protein
MELTIINYLLITLITGFIGYLAYLHRHVVVLMNDVSQRYTKHEVEHIMDLKLKPVNDRTIMLEDRLERLERKIDRILEVLGKKA